MDLSKTRYQAWLNDPLIDPDTIQELKAIADNPGEIEDRFYMDLQFGTAGLRGLIGAGTNRMNRYTVARAASGYARYLAGQGQNACDRGLVISYDSRRYSAEFALQAALICCSEGIRVYLSDTLRPVPMLSYAIRFYRTAGGIMITASHNPAQYNGFKAYGEDGGQLPPEDAATVSNLMETIEQPAALTWPSADQARAAGLLVDLGAELDQAYTDMLLDLSINRSLVKKHKDMKIVYTPLHGAGYRPVMRILQAVGFEQVQVVESQALPDPDFPTVESPNPEERAALQLAIDQARREQAQLVIATDPDGDRTGLAVRTASGDYQVLTGNQIGLLLMEYILSARKEAKTLPEGGFVVTTIVSTKLTRRVAAAYGVRLYECLTGFKFIAELIKNLDEQGDESYLFGFEESFGFLAGTEVRDKDAVVTSMLIAEMAAVAREHGQTLYDRLMSLYERYGYAAEKTLSLTLAGKTGIERIQKAMQTLRQQKKTGFPGIQVQAVCDYQERQRLDLATGRTSTLDLPESDVLLYELGELDWFCVRPSGTEPKIKIYFGLYRDSHQEADQALDQLQQAVGQVIDSVL